ncbi:MAG: MBL fold metallo-hydrolase [Chlamydiales bacterium]|nr:MBL fold metallo-hydrolase [Chlamydiales bacterium]
MTSIYSITENLFTVANNIHQNFFHFRIETERDGTQIIKKNGVLREIFFYFFYSSQSHKKTLQDLINQNVSDLSSFGRENFIAQHTCETTELFIAAQKYNQTVERTKKYPKTLGHQLTLNLVHNPKVLELNPSKILAVKDVLIPEDLQNDKPTVCKENRMCIKHNVRRYPGDNIDHSTEASRIFISTQKERLLSIIGRVIEAISKIFGFKVNTFQKYHYRKNNETDEQIYAASISPLSNTVTEPTSFWLGHASLFLSIPLKSPSGKLAAFHVITDPVEGDLNAILYPRQTKFARPIEKMPAPDVYLLSHNHLDHYSKETVKKLFAQQPIMMVPQGDKERYSTLAKELGFDDANIIELDWWEKKKVTFEKNGETFFMQISATPARHWSGQGPCGGHESTFLGYVIQGHEEGDIYFAGDTARLSDNHIQKLQDHFNIRWNFQPGGPDEVRKDMESTHQASVDGLWMHFKMMIPKIYTKGMDKQEFLKRAIELKTIYMHTMTYKLGNLHISDTKDSVDKVLKALESDEIEALELKSYEEQVYHELCDLGDRLTFSQSEKLLHSEVALLLAKTVIVPKIGSRIGLKGTKAKQTKSIYF